MIFPFQPIAGMPIPIFNSDKWRTDGGKTLDELGFQLPTIENYGAFTDITTGGVASGMPENGAPFAKLWDNIITTTFMFTYRERVPSFQDPIDFYKHLEAHFNINCYLWASKWCTAYYSVIKLTNTTNDSESITHLETHDKTGESTTTSSASMSANGDKTTVENNSPQVLAEIATTQEYIDNYAKASDTATSSANNNATASNSGSDTIDYTHTRTTSGTLGKLPIELQELYATKMHNLTYEIINSYEKFFVGDLYYV